MSRLIGSRQDMLILGLLAALTLSGYWQVHSFQFIELDDPDYVTNNPAVLAGLTPKTVTWAFTTTCASNWHPLTWMSLMLDTNLADWLRQLSGVELGKENSGVYHVTNAVLHLANVMLLFVVLNRLTGSRWRSAFVAALFGIHPAHVESVAWVAERKDVLSTLFWLLTMMAYAAYVQRARSAYLGLACVMLAVGLTAKPMLVSLPIVLLLIDFWPLERLRAKGVRVRTLVLEKLPMLALVAVSSGVTVWAQRAGGAVLALHHCPLGVRMANAAVAYVAYLGKMIWPSDLAVFYLHPLRTLATWQVAGSYVLLAGITALALMWARRRPYFLVGWLWYAITLIPVIGIVQVGSQAMADRYTYVPYIGLFIIIAWGIPEIIGRLAGASRIWASRAVAVAAVGVLIVLAALNYAQVRCWRDGVALFSHAVAVNDRNPAAHCNVGIAYAIRGSNDQAIRHYKEAVGLAPNYARAHCYLGRAYGDLKQYGKAIRECQLAIQINPDFAEAHCNLGRAYQDVGRYDEAIEEYEEAIRIDPNSVDARNSLGNALVLAGDPEAALEQLQEAVRSRPQDAELRFNLGNAYNGLGDSQNAIRAYRAATQIDPRHAAAWNAIGAVLARQREFAEAIPYFQKALEIEPGNANYRSNLEKAQQLLGWR